MPTEPVVILIALRVSMALIKMPHVKNVLKRTIIHMPMNAVNVLGFGFGPHGGVNVSYVMQLIKKMSCVRIASPVHNGIWPGQLILEHAAFVLDL